MSRTGDSQTMAYLNMFAVLGTLQELCREAHGETAEILTNKKPVSIVLSVKDGPSATYTFDKGFCTVVPGIKKKYHMKIPFRSCQSFNHMINGLIWPISLKKVSHINAPLKNFTRLTELLRFYLKEAPEDNEVSARLLFYAAVSAISQVGNWDPVGRSSASHIPDGTVMLSVKGGPKAAITVQDHILTTIKAQPETPKAIMEFADPFLLRKLFSGQENFSACIGTGEISVYGMLPMINKIKRILSRSADYLI